MKTVLAGTQHQMPSGSAVFDDPFPEVSPVKITTYVFERDPHAFEDELEARKKEGYRILNIMVRPRPDGSAFCYAKIRLGVLGLVKKLLTIDA